VGPLQWGEEGYDAKLGQGGSEEPLRSLFSSLSLPADSVLVTQALSALLCPLLGWCS
jgi:hypothetical protein